MWTLVLWFGVGTLLDPVRVGIAAVVLSRRQAMRNLLAFWLGGIVASLLVGVAVLILLRDVALVGVRFAASIITDVRSAVILLDGEHLRITLGLLSLVGLAVMLAKDRASMRTPVAVGSGVTLEVPPPRRRYNPLAPILAMAARTYGMLESGFMWPAFVVGLLSTFPPIEGPIMLSIIMGSRAAAGIQFIAFMLFTLLVLTFIEIPLVCYLAAPDKTESVMLRMNTWVTSHRRQIFETMLAVTGTLSLVQGISSL